LKNLFTLVLVLLAITPARASIPRDLYFVAESTNRNEAQISSAASGMPSKSMLLLATFHKYAAGFSGRTVYFSIHSGSGITLTPTSGITDGLGQVALTITGNGSNSTDLSPVVIRAKLVDGVFELNQYITIYLRTTNPTKPNPWSINTFGYALGVAPINYYYYPSISAMQPYASGSMSAWVNSPDVSFQPSNGQQKVEFEEIEDYTAGAHMWCTALNPPWIALKRITYNMAQLDDYFDPYSFEWPTIPFLGQRSYVQAGANHEMGHALLYAHVSNYSKTIMWDGFGVGFFFVHDITDPVGPRTLDPILGTDWPQILATY
jgi:hypothetical protein